MWVFNASLLEILLRTIIIYFVVLVGIRVAGKREVGQMTPFDLVLLLLIANAVQNAMTGPDTSVTGGLVAALTLLVLNVIVTRTVRGNRHLRRWVQGSPTLLIHSGHIQHVNIEREHLTCDELFQALREHGIATVEEVHLAVLEIDGSISVLKKDEVPQVSRPHHRIRFVHKGSG
ncbi:MAG: DUF421 domain-containing protein [Acidobacteria bacterium]|nr:DUF421 domain-containing protein [Acidobacteriota bacterium]